MSRREWEGILFTREQPIPDSVQRLTEYLQDARPGSTKFTAFHDLLIEKKTRHSLRHNLRRAEEDPALLQEKGFTRSEITSDIRVAEYKLALLEIDRERKAVSFPGYFDVTDDLEHLVEGVVEQQMSSQSDWGAADAWPPFSRSMDRTILFLEWQMEELRERKPSHDTDTE